MAAVKSDTAARRSLWWRIHLWAALMASPFALLALLTGTLYVFTPQIERALYAHLDQVTPDGTPQDLDRVVATALANVGRGTELVAVLPGAKASDSVRVTVREASGVETTPVASTIYVDPYRLTVLGRLNDAERFNQWARKLHSSLLLGEGWRWMIELAASGLLVMLLTGVMLWSPRTWRDGLPQAQLDGRRFWRQWHAFIGVLLMALTATMLLTGITWSRYAGSEVRAARDALGQAPIKVDSSLRSTLGAGEALTWQRAWQLGEQYTGQRALQLVAPNTPDGVWKITLADRTQPLAQFTLILDAYTGAVLQRLNSRDQPLFVQATAVGIPFHRGELGAWNQWLLGVFAVGIGFSLVSGWLMYFKRSRHTRFGLPPLLPGAWRSQPWAMWLGLLLLLALLPTLRLAAAAVLLLEWWWRRREPMTAV